MKTTDLVNLFVDWPETREQALKVLDEGSDIPPDVRLTVQMILWQAWFCTTDQYFVSTLYYEQARVPTRNMNLQRRIGRLREDVRQEFPEMVEGIDNHIKQMETEDPARLVDLKFSETVERSIDRIVGLI
jgi:hypothetical protein